MYLFTIELSIYVNFVAKISPEIVVNNPYPVLINDWKSQKVNSLIKRCSDLEVHLKEQTGL